MRFVLKNAGRFAFGEDPRPPVASEAMLKKICFYCIFGENELCVAQPSTQ